MGDLSPFRRALQLQKTLLEQALLKGTSTPFSLAVNRLVILMMTEDLKTGGTFADNALLNETVGSPATVIWQRKFMDMAEKKLDPELGDPSGFRKKVDDYKAVAKDLRRNVRKTIRYFSSTEIEIVNYNQETIKIIDIIAQLFADSVYDRKLDDGFMKLSARDALYQFVTVHRPELFVVYRIAMNLGPDVATIVLPEKSRPWYVAAVEFGVSFIPFVGNAVAAYEAYRGKDLFGYQLSDVERGILAASVLLPMAGRFVKEGRAMYTAERMSRLYGADAYRWSYAMAMGERLTEEASLIRRLKQADEVVASGERVSRELGTEVTQVLEKIGIDGAEKAVPKEIDAKLVSAFEAVVKKHPNFAELDALAIERIAAKKTADHVKGQLLEEVLENKIVQMLKDPAGKKALGFEAIKEELEFIPGHVIRDANSRLITDGVIVRRMGEKLEILAVFEAKAGKSAARELSAGVGSFSDAAKEELEAYANDILRDMQSQAARDGTTVTTTLEEIMKDIKKTEAGGQIRRDIERLSELGIKISGEKAEIIFSPTKTKFFGVIPSDVKASTITQELKKASIANFEVIGVGLKQKELNSAADIISTMLNIPKKKP